jgi:hypothetical protein
VLDYRVSWDQGSLINSYSVLAESVKIASFTTTIVLNSGMLYKFKVEARNAVGFSKSFSNEVSIFAPCDLKSIEVKVGKPFGSLTYTLDTFLSPLNLAWTSFLIT